jgi:hypothetical protein
LRSHSLPPLVDLAVPDWILGVEKSNLLDFWQKLPDGAPSNSTNPFFLRDVPELSSQPIEKQQHVYLPNSIRIDYVYEGKPRKDFRFSSLMAERFVMSFVRLDVARILDASSVTNLEKVSPCFLCLGLWPALFEPIFSLHRIWPS